MPVNLLWWLKPKLAFNETMATIYWESGDEDDVVLTYESGIYYNHELSIAIDESDIAKVDVYEYDKPNRHANYIGQHIELRTDPPPVGESSAVWNALETQDLIASSGTRTSRMVAPSRFDNRAWQAVKLWSFVAGLIILAIIVMWSLKLGSDAIDVIDTQITDELERQAEDGSLNGSLNGSLDGNQPTPTIDYGWKWIPPSGQ